MEQSELPHFHFNEALLKPFENILNMHDCDSDVQDQIITCCMMIVEAHRSELKSGWRPLFQTLSTKNVIRNHSTCDIFRIFLETENTLVFSNAGLDCILCLLSFLETTTGSNPDEEFKNGECTEKSKLPNGNGLLQDVLKFLERCSTILGCLYNMPNTRNLHSTYKIKGISYTHIVDANTQNTMDNFQYFGNEHLQNVNDQFAISYRSLYINKESITKLETLEKSGCGVLKVWFLLLDGLTNALLVCPTSHQSPIIQTIFKIFRSVFENPGYDFGFYCVNHLLIPLNQDWLRHTNKTLKAWASVEKNFKLCLGESTNFVVEFIEKSEHKLNDKSSTVNVEGEKSKIPMAANLALKQLLLVLIECSVQSQEGVSRIGVSCLKHIIFTIGFLFNEEQWLTVCSAIHRASALNLAPLRQLSFAFHENSNSFYGDIATVKVAARRDCTIEEINRVFSLSQQVFQLDSQKDSVLNKVPGELKTANGDRSYAFLLYPNLEADGNFVIRIPYRNLVIGLLVSQMLLQLIANVLLGGLKCVAQTELHSVIYDSSSSTSNEKKPQFNLSYRAKEILYRCLRQYLNCSIEFDQRPGLKFLIQKVSNLDFAANLYKQLTSSFIIIFMSLVDLYLSDIEKLNLSSHDLKVIIASAIGENNLHQFFVQNFNSLREVWDQIANLYLNAVKLSKRKESITEINIVENDLYNNDFDGDVDEVFLPNTDENEKSSSESFHNYKFLAPQQRENPFNNIPETKPQIVSKEIELQRAVSIMRDENSKRKSLTQLVVASMELLKLLPNESAENIKLLLSPKINEAFDMIESVD